MDIAVIKSGGKQYLVSEGTTLYVEKIGARSKTVEYKSGDSITFDEVLFKDDGKTATVGTPAISGAKVTAKVVQVGRAAKIYVERYKAKSRYLKRNGHRQPFIKVKVLKIG